MTTIAVVVNIAEDRESNRRRWREDGDGQSVVLLRRGVLLRIPAAGWSFSTQVLG